MELCGEGCYPICDFCKFYDFNGDKRGCYIEEGFCNFHKSKRDPIDECNDFVCGMPNKRSICNDPQKS